MRNLSPLFISVFILLSCSAENDTLKSDPIADMFPGIYFSGETGVYVDDRGNPVTDDLQKRNENGELVSELRFENGLIVSGSIWNDEGKVSAVYSTEDNLPTVTYMDDNGQKSALIQYKNNMNDPVTFKTWHSNGTLSTESTQSHFRSWHENGQLGAEVTLIDGISEGAGYAWHENGELAAESHFSEGQWHGIFKKWDENGNLVEQKSYDMGMPHGTHTTWDRDGNIIKEIEYKDGKPLATLQD